MARRPKIDQRTAQRARIVLDCAAGLSNTAVATKREVTLQTVGKWRQRFLDGGPGAPGDAPRSGQPRKLTDAKVEAVITRTLETRPKHATHWSTRTLAEASGLNQNAIVRIWRAFGLKPHLQENFKLSTDAFFVEKVRAVLEKFATVQMIDVHLPTTDGREIVMARHTQPEQDLQLLRDQLKLELPEQGPPKIQALQ